jgi:hypothetical protein
MQSVTYWNMILLFGIFVCPIASGVISISRNITSTKTTWHPHTSKPFCGHMRTGTTSQLGFSRGYKLPQSGFEGLVRAPIIDPGVEPVVELAALGNDSEMTFIVEDLCKSRPLCDRLSAVYDRTHLSDLGVRAEHVLQAHHDLPFF